MRRVSRVIDTGFKEFGEHIVFVRRDDKARNREPHLLRNPAGEDVAEVAGRDGKRNRLALFGRGKPPLEVIDHLSGNARPVDGVHGADRMRGLERVVVRDRLHDVLRLIERPADRDIEDIGVFKRIHLGALEVTHAAVRRQHKDADPFPAPHRVFGSGPGIT